MSNNFFTLKKLTGSKQKDLRSTFQKMAEMLKSTDVPGKFQFQIFKGEEAAFFHIDVSKKSVKLNAKKVQKPDFEIITNDETWLEIATGTLSPLRAFLQNKIRVRGDVGIGERFLKQFSGSGSKETSK